MTKSGVNGYIETKRKIAIDTFIIANAHIKQKDRQEDERMPQKENCSIFATRARYVDTN
jgi:hypothetical protein